MTIEKVGLWILSPIIFACCIGNSKQANSSSNNTLDLAYTVCSGGGCNNVNFKVTIDNQKRTYDWGNGGYIKPFGEVWSIADEFSVTQFVGNMTGSAFVFEINLQEPKYKRSIKWLHTLSFTSTGECGGYSAVGNDIGLTVLFKPYAIHYVATNTKCSGRIDLKNQVGIAPKPLANSRGSCPQDASVCVKLTNTRIVKSKSGILADEYHYRYANSCAGVDVTFSYEDCNPGGKCQLQRYGSIPFGTSGPLINYQRFPEPQNVRCRVRH